MESPHFALAFMNKLANSPWAPVIRLIEDPDILGFEPSLNLQEDLEDCALVVEETDSPVQRKTSNPECSSGENSSVVARYYPSPCDSDDSVVICEDVAALEPSHNGRRPPNSSSTTSATGSRQGTAYEPGPKRKKRVPSSPATSSKSKPCSNVKQSQSSSSLVQNGGENYSGGTAIAHIGNDQTQLIEYNGYLLKLKPMKVVLIDLACILCKQPCTACIDSRKPFKSSGDESATDICKNPKIKLKPIMSESDESTIIDVEGIDEGPSEDLKNSRSSDVGNFKRPRENLSWGLDSIQELEKRRKLGKTVRSNHSDEQDAELATCSTGALPRPANSVTSRSKSKPPSSSFPNNTFGLNAWRLGLVMQELKRLHELAEKLQKNHLKPEMQKQIAYTFKYGLNEVARLVTKKSLNTIIAEHERAELKELREKECRALIEQNVAKKAAPGSGRFSKEMSPSDKLKQINQLDTEKNATSTSKELESTSTLDRPVVDVYMPTLVQGVAAGFLGIFDRLEKLESQCDNIEKRVTKSKETQSIYIREVE